MSAVGEREFLLVGAAPLDELTSPIAYWKEDDFVPLLQELNPDVVHLHHYVHLGVEIIRTIRNALPHARIFLTLHEYVAICSNFGQMIKTSGRLCYQSSPRECSQCFPGKAPEDFFLRERYIKSFFDLVDHFVSPSAFLRDRYIAWGLNPNKIERDRKRTADRRKAAAARPGGRRNARPVRIFRPDQPVQRRRPYPRSLLETPRLVRSQVSLDIFGSGLESQVEAFREKINGLLAANKDVVRLHGPYEQDELPSIMQSIDWVVMGSVWWENSPVVIQEAYKFGRPIICPDIGGMAEKVLNGVGGIHYRARDAVALASVLTAAHADCERYSKLVESLPSYFSQKQCADAHLELFNRYVDRAPARAAETGLLVSVGASLAAAIDIGAQRSRSADAEANRLHRNRGPPARVAVPFDEGGIRDGRPQHREPGFPSRRMVDRRRTKKF